MSSELERRFDYLIERLRTGYDSIGHSSGRPYIYFVYPPEQERHVQRMIHEQLRDDARLTFHHIDILPLTIACLAGQEQRRQQLLEDPLTRDSATEAIVRRWTRKISDAIATSLAATTGGEHPVVVLLGLAALHPLGTPTSLMEFIAEQEPRNPASGAMVPIVLFVPGSHLPQTSRTYLFLDQERLQLAFYRGEEI